MNSYLRAKTLANTFDVSADDIMNLTPKFWDIHTDPIATMDGAAYVFLVVQLNLAAGTLAPYARKRPDLRPLLESMLKFDVS